MSHVSDFTQGPAKIILDLINDTNDSTLTLDQVDISDPVPQEDEQVKVTVTPKPGSGYTGSVEVYYNRLNMYNFSLIFFPEFLTLPAGNAEYVSDLLPQVNTAFGIALTAQDIIDGPITGWTGEPNQKLPVELMIQENNLVYYYGTAVILEGNDIPLSNVITSLILDGLNLPVGEEPEVYNPDEFTRYRINSEIQENDGKLTFSYIWPEYPVRYRLDDGAIQTLATGSDVVLTVPAGTSHLDLSNSAPFNATVTNSQTEAVFFEAIEYFQITAQPIIGFSKTSFFVSVPTTIPASLTNVTDLFLDAGQFNQDISGWDTSNILYFTRMFKGTSIFNQDIGGWNVGNALNMTEMFYGSGFNQDIGGWNVSSVNQVNGMFAMSGFNQDISGWSMGAVTDMSGMFFQNEAFNQDLSGLTLPAMSGPAAWFNYDTDTFSWVLPRPTFQGIEPTLGGGIAWNIDVSGWSSNVMDEEWMPQSGFKYGFNTSSMTGGPNGAILEASPYNPYILQEAVLGRIWGSPDKWVIHLAVTDGLAKTPVAIELWDEAEGTLITRGDFVDTNNAGSVHMYVFDNLTVEASIDDNVVFKLIF